MRTIEEIAAAAAEDIEGHEAHQLKAVLPREWLHARIESALREALGPVEEGLHMALEDIKNVREVAATVAETWAEHIPDADQSVFEAIGRSIRKIKVGTALRGGEEK